MKILKMIPTSVAHDLAPWALGVYADWVNSQTQKPFYHWQSFQWRNLHFRNPVGIAGGVDKSGESLLNWQSVGAGFLEVGTVTPRPQRANKGRILARDFSSGSLWNKMGFPNDGVDELKARLSNQKLEVPLFINIGKNRDTPPKKAIDDYAELVSKLKDFSETFVVNLSSPNTPGLRSLLEPQHIREIFKNLHQLSPPSNFLLKLSPDVTEEELKAQADAGLENGASGFVLTNTTTQRTGAPAFPESGGISGNYLKPRSQQCLAWLHQHLENLGTSDRPLIVSTGGISSYEDVQERLKMGAQLVQMYSSFIFQGPGLLRKFSREASR